MKTLLFTLSFISFIGFSQNWQSIKSIDTNYFKANAIGNDYIIASQIDSVNYINSDSIFYPFRTLRRLDMPFDVNGAICSAIPDDSWLGHKIIIKPNGDNLFFNKAGDTILIKTLSSLNDSYTLYTYSDGSSIEATITNIQQETILGITDSVKTFTLTSNNSIFYLDNQSFKIGKTSGFIQFIPFYSFPFQYSPNLIETPALSSEYSIIGKENPKVGITKPTFYDIYNLEIGDILQHRTDGGPLHNIYEKEILTKTLYSTDSVEYTIKRSHFVDYDGTSAQDPSYTTPITIDTIIKRYKISNEYISEKIPEKMYFNHLLPSTPIWVDSVIKITHNYDCGFTLANHHSGYYNTLIQNDTLYYDDWHGATKNTYYISSAFSNYYNCYDPQIGGCEYSSSLISKNTTSYICGTPFYLNLTKQSLQNQLNFYPNPATNQITIPTEITNLKIYSNIGQLVLEILEPQHDINVSTLTKGLYFVVGVNKENTTFTAKLIKN